MTQLDITFRCGESVQPSMSIFTLSSTERRIIGVPNQKSMDKLLLDSFADLVGIIFNDAFSYKLKFVQGYNIPFLKEDLFTGDFPYKISLWYFSCFQPKE